MGCDERRAVHYGNPGAAATGSSSLGSGAGRRGRARGARAGSEEAGGRAGQRGARREKARAAKRAQAGHLAAAAAAEPPVSAARTPSPRAPSPPSGSGRRALPAAGACERRGLALTSGRRARRGPRQSLAHTAPSQALPVPCGIPFGFVQKANPEANFSQPRPPARALLWEGDSWGPSLGDPAPGGRADGWAWGRRRPRGTGWPARARAPGSGCARSWTW